MTLCQSLQHRDQRLQLNGEWIPDNHCSGEGTSTSPELSASSTEVSSKHNGNFVISKKIFIYLSTLMFSPTK